LVGLFSEPEPIQDQSTGRVSEHVDDIVYRPMTDEARAAVAVGESRRDLRRHIVWCAVGTDADIISARLHSCCRSTEMIGCSPPIASFDGDYSAAGFVELRP
jgi:hypothetical protein